MSFTSILEARVNGVNKANAAAMELWDKLSPIFAPFVGQQIEKATGGLFAKVAKLLPEMPCSPSLHVYKYSSPYQLAWVVKTCNSFNGSAYYYEATCQIGEMRDGVLTALSPRPVLRTNYNVREVLDNRKKFEEAQKEYHTAQGNLYPFGEYDR